MWLQAQQPAFGQVAGQQAMYTQAPNQQAMYAQAPMMTAAAVVPPAAVVAPEAGNEKKVPTTANSTYNLNGILAGTITGSEYFLSLLSEYESFEAVIEVIRTECVHLEAFEPGKAHAPSVAFCCMYKLFMLKLDVGQMRFMLRHKSVYVRGVAMLYLRNIGESGALMNWLELHLEDETEFAATSEPTRKVTMSKWLLSLITDHKYCGVVLRRIPVPICRNFERKGLEILVRQERTERARHNIIKDMECKAKWTDGVLYEVVVDEVLANGNFLVTYPAYGNQEEIAISEFQLESIAKQVVPDRSEKSEKEKDSRDSDRSRKDRSRSRDRRKDRSRSKDRSRDRRRSRSRSRDRDRSRGRDRRKRSRSPPGRAEGKASNYEGMTIEQEVEIRFKKKREQERTNATSGDGKYCAQIVSYKKSLSKQFKGGATFETTNRKLDLPDSHPRGSSRTHERRSRRDRSPSPEYAPKRKELTQKEKHQKQQLLQLYGDASSVKGAKR